MKNKKVITLIITLSIVVVGCGTMFSINYNRYGLVKDSVQVELGSSISEEVRDYVVAGNKKAVDGTKLDFSGVDFDKAGTYEATAKYGKKTLTFEVVVDDSVNPVVTVKPNDAIIKVGTELNVSDYVNEATDKSGIKGYKLFDGETELAKGDKLEDLKFKIDSNGTHSLTIQAEDMSGNIGEESFDIKVIKDYEPMVTGFKDWSFQEGSELPDFMEGIEKTDEIASVTPKTDTIDANTVGTYTLTYEVLGDDNETTFTHDVSVTVTAKPVEKPKKQTTSSGSQGSSNSSSGSKSSNSSGNSSQGSSGSSSGGGSSDSDEYLDFLNSEWQGKTVGEYTAAHGYGICDGTPSGRLFFYPDDYVIGSHATLTFSDGTTMTGL